MDYCKLNSIMVRDTFPLPRIDGAQQAIHSSNWFSSFGLAQGYLPLAMEQGDIKIQHLELVYTSLLVYPSKLSNAGSSFCCLMEQCLGDQQFVTLLLYLDDICIFAPTIDEMLDCIQLVFDRLKNLILNLSLKGASFSALVCYSRGMSYWPRAYQPTQRRWKKVRPGMWQRTPRRCNPLWD